MNEVTNSMMILRGARLVVPNGVVTGKSIVVDRGLISRITDHGDFSGAARTLDLDGLTIFPGFIDVHIHGAAGIDTMRANVADLLKVSKFLSTQGVTSWMPTLVPGPPPDYARAIEAIELAMVNPAEGAGIFGVHYEGPFVNTAQCGALRQQYFLSFSGVSDLDALPTIQNSSAKHMITVAPEISGGIELVGALCERGWIVSLGHTRAGFEILDQAYEAGARHMTHFMNAMAPLHHRAPGPVGWGLARDNVTCDMIADGIHLDPQVLRLLLKLKGADRLSLISDAIAAAGLGDGEYQIWGETIAVKNGRTGNARGAIAGSVITMLDALRLMRSLGVSEIDLAKMASGNPARLLGIDNECGSIEEGKRADLVALNDAAEVMLTMVGGRIAFQV